MLPVKLRLFIQTLLNKAMRAGKRSGNRRVVIYSVNQQCVVSVVIHSISSKTVMEDRCQETSTAYWCANNGVHALVDCRFTSRSCSRFTINFVASFTTTKNRLHMVTALGLMTCLRVLQHPQLWGGAELAMGSKRRKVCVL